LVNNSISKKSESPVPLVPENGQNILIELTRLKACRYQKRTTNPESVHQLADTIKQNGLLQNVTARPLVDVPGFDYELIAGHRRTEAFRRLCAEATTPEECARWSRIPCTVKLGLNEIQVAALSAVENLEREDGDALTQALSLLEVKKAGEFTLHVQVAEATGMGLQRVTRLLRLAQAPAMIQRAVHPGISVQIEEPNGALRNHHAKLGLSVVLAVLPLHRFYERTVAPESVVKRTERFLQRVAKGNWSRIRVDEEVKRLTSRSQEQPQNDGEQPAEPSASVDDAAPVGDRQLLLFRDKGVQFIIYPKNAMAASDEQRASLISRLKKLTTELEPSRTATITVDSANR